MCRVESLRGKLLIASPGIVDPSFRRAVVLVAEHSEEGAMGLVLNRVSEVTVGESVPALEWIAAEEQPVHVGGPVAESSVIVLAEFDDPARAALLLEDDLGFIPAEAEDPGGLADATRRTRVFAGHAGWGPGQLDAEMAEESWIVGEPRRSDVFTDEPDELWAVVLRRMGREYALLSTMPLDPSLN
jgi:putative transcriptional regulator